MLKKFILTLFTLIIITLPNSAMAVEQLNYREKISSSLKYQINSFLQKTYETDISIYYIANIDLNSDGIDEYVLKRKSCIDNKNQCIYSIIAEKDGEIILLSKIRAKNLIIGETSSYGIKDILAFKDKINDYNFDIYMWSATEKKYIINAR